MSDKPPSTIPPRLQGRNNSENLDKIDKARTLGLTGLYTVEEIAGICGMTPYLAELALKWQEIDDIVKADGEREFQETVRRHRSQRARSADKAGDEQCL